MCEIESINAEIGVLLAILVILRSHVNILRMNCQIHVLNGGVEYRMIFKASFRDCWVILEKSEVVCKIRVVNN